MTMTGYSKSSLERCIEAICTSEGHTWVPYSLLKQKNSCSDLRPLIKQGRIYWENLDGRDYFTLPSYKESEEESAIKIAQMLNSEQKKFPDEVINRYIKEKDTAGTLDKQQANAVRMAVNNSICVLTGGPGTGKTYTLNVIDYVLRKVYPSAFIAYTAPTGKAAKRIKESTGNEARTLHKKLQISVNKTSPTYLAERILVIDESSMIDASLCQNLFRALSPMTRVIFVGDVDQLPSVGPGAVLRDLIECGCVPVTKLIKTFRQKGESLILDNMKNVRDGICKMEVGNDFIISRPNETNLSSVDWLVGAYINKAYEYGIDNTALLTPYRQMKYKTGAEYLNSVIQQKVQGNKPKLYMPNKPIGFVQGDRVIQLQNRTECANGDTGIVVDMGKHGMTVEYVEAIVNYEQKDLAQVSLAYALSVHKSQGSEYSAVISCMLKEHEMMLQRNLLYTAITRAKKDFVLFADDDAICKAIKTEASGLRSTMLQEKIKIAVNASRK